MGWGEPPSAQPLVVLMRPLIVWSYPTLYQRLQGMHVIQKKHKRKKSQQILDCPDKTWRQKSCFSFIDGAQSIRKMKRRTRFLYKRWTSMSNRNGVTINHWYAIIASIVLKIVWFGSDMMSSLEFKTQEPEAKLALASKWLCNLERHASAECPNFWHNSQRKDGLKFDLQFCWPLLMDCWVTGGFNCWLLWQ